VEAAKRLYLDRFAASKLTNVKRAGTPGTLAFLTFMHQLDRLVMVPYMGPEDAKYDTIGIYAAVLQPGLSSKRFGVHNMPTAADLAWTNWDSKLSVTENIKTSKNLALPSMVVAALDIKSFPEVPELDEKASVERKLYAAKNPGDLEQRIVLSTVEFNRNARSAFVDPVCKACFKFLFDVYFRQPFMGPCCSLLQKFHGSRKKTSRYGPVSGEEYNYGPNFLATYVQLFMSLPLKRASGETGLRQREYEGLDLPEFLELAFNPFPVFGRTPNMEASIECGLERDYDAVKQALNVPITDSCAFFDAFYGHFKAFPANPSKEDVVVLMGAIQTLNTWRSASNVKFPYFAEEERSGWRERRYKGLMEKYEEEKKAVEGNTVREMCLWTAEGDPYLTIKKKLLVTDRSESKDIERVNTEAMYGKQFDSFEKAEMFAGSNLPRQVDTVRYGKTWWETTIKPFLLEKAREGKCMRLMPLTFKMVVPSGVPGQTKFVNRTGLISSVPVGSWVDVTVGWSIYEKNGQFGIKFESWGVVIVGLPGEEFFEYEGQNGQMMVPDVDPDQCFACDEALPGLAPSVSSTVKSRGDGAFTEHAEALEGGPAGAGGPKTLPSEEDEDGHVPEGL